VCHVVFVALALFGTPKLFDDTVSRPIEVEIVRSEDLPPEKAEEPPKETAKAEKPKEPGEPEKDKPAPWDPLPNTAEAALQPKPDQSAPKPNERQAGAQQQVLQPQPQQPQSQQPREPSIFDPANITKLMNLPNAPESGFDSESTTSANISDDDKAVFRSHLRKCWKLPSSVSSPTTRVVLRVYLRRDGKLASEPVLIEASASRDGPVVMQTAIRALRECQPYGFLPAAKYSEWKVLDLSFSPREMSGG
jgi:hypothetical protein